MPHNNYKQAASLEHLPNLVEVIRHWLDSRPDAEILRFYPQGEGQFNTYSYQQFDQRCQAIASHLQQYRGQRVILLFNSGLEFLEAFFACFYAGVIAVPAYPPRRNHNLDRLLNLINDCQPRLFISSSAVMQLAHPICIEAFDNNAQQIDWLDTDTVIPKDADDYQFFSPAPTDLAFLQYTSGSTGKPKGVMVSHHNLMVNVQMAKQHFALPETLRCVSWLPLFHDMGLIGAVMMPLFWGGSAILMPPAAFLQKPLRWLKLLHEYGQQSPVGCAAPNFAYQMCIDHISEEEIAQLDLHNWIFSLAGAEPNRSQTLQQFCQKFAPTGFKPSSLAPSYGMAECTLLSTTARFSEDSSIAICADALQRGLFQPQAESNMVLVSAGKNCLPQTLLIVDAETLAPKADGHIGEICLSGEHIAQGYWGQEALSQASFQAFSTDGQGPFLRTGDLGCIYQGQLYITGRLKDLLIIRGRNHYPQDLELSCSNSSASLHLDNAAAFTIETQSEEQLVLVQEINRSHRKDFDAQTTVQLIRNNIAREHGIEVSAIAFIRFASIPKTSSGKIQRHLVKQQYIAQQLKLIDLWQAEPTEKKQLPSLPNKALADATQYEIEQWIQQWLANKLSQEISMIPLDGALDGLGLDSVDLVQLAGELENWLQQPLDNMLVWEQPHIRALATTLLSIATKTDSSDDDDNDEIEGFI